MELLRDANLDASLAGTFQLAVNSEFGVNVTEEPCSLEGSDASKMSLNRLPKHGPYRELTFSMAMSIAALKYILENVRPHPWHLDEACQPQYSGSSAGYERASDALDHRRIVYTNICGRSLSGGHSQRMVWNGSPLLEDAECLSPKITASEVCFAYEEPLVLSMGSAVVRLGSPPPRDRNTSYAGMCLMTQ